MKNISLNLLIICTLSLLYSCAPVYRCGEERPVNGIQGNNRLLAVVDERDDLCDEVKTKTKENDYLVKANQKLALTNDSLATRNRKVEGLYSDLQEKHKELQKEHVDLSERFSKAITNNLNQGHLYDERIKEKERRLDLKEQELTARERRIRELENKIASQDSIAKRLNRLLKEALLGFDSDELTTEIKDGKVYVSMSDKLMFQSGKADVEAKGKKALGILANVLKKNTDFNILVEGHTDNVPINTKRYHDNWDLSVDRATAIVRILQDDYTVDPLRLTASGRGEFYPKASNSTAAGRAKNRRTEIILSPDFSELMDLIGE